jgi:DNA-binding GntR family transcriptional regulator
MSTQTRVPRQPTGKAGTDGAAETQVSRICEAIEADILAGSMPPGAHLSEHGLAERFGVSRTPVREAIRQLAASGLVQVEARRGAFVARPQLARLIELFEYMSELEATSARLAARRMTIAEKAELKQVHEACRRHVDSGNPAAYFEDSHEFHSLIFRGAKNSVLADAAESLYLRLTPYRRRQMHLTNRANRSFDEHQAVLEAILLGDGDAAEAAMRSHTGIVGENVLDLLSALADR